MFYHSILRKTSSDCAACPRSHRLALLPQRGINSQPLAPQPIPKPLCVNCRNIKFTHTFDKKTGIRIYSELSMKEHTIFKGFFKKRGSYHTLCMSPIFILSHICILKNNKQGKKPQKAKCLMLKGEVSAVLAVLLWIFATGVL